MGLSFKRFNEILPVPEYQFVMQLSSKNGAPTYIKGQGYAKKNHLSFLE